MGAAAYYTLVVAVGAAAIGQIAWEAFFTPIEPAPYPTCSAGLRALHDAVERGRRAASFADGLAAGGFGEEAALERYRAAVRPVWRYRDAVARLCRDTPETRSALDTIERLRYAEEHNVRSQAAELGPLRRRARALALEPSLDRPTP